MDTDRRLHETDPGLHHVPIGMEDSRLRCPTEHHVELREAEDEALRLVDEQDLRTVPELFGQPRGQFEPTETRSKHQHSHQIPLPPEQLRADSATFSHSF